MTAVTVLPWHTGKGIYIMKGTECLAAIAFSELRNPKEREALKRAFGNQGVRDA